MKWTIAYTQHARKDIKTIYEYIANELLVPNSASAQIQRIFKVIRSLDEMPMRFKCYDVEPWYSKGLRAVPIDNYIVFYLPNETTRTVHIIRIMYSRRNIKQQLEITELD